MSSPVPTGSRHPEVADKRTSECAREEADQGRKPFSPQEEKLWAQGQEHRETPYTRRHCPQSKERKEERKEKRNLKKGLTGKIRNQE